MKTQTITSNVVPNFTKHYSTHIYNHEIFSFYAWSRSLVCRDYNKIQARTVTKLLGNLRTQEYGTLSSDFVTEFMPSAVIDTSNVTVDNIDSLKLVMTVPFESIVGDTLAPMRVNVYRLNKRLPFPIYSDFNPTEYYSESDLLGSTSYTMSNSIYTSDYYNNVYHYCVVEVDLPKQLGKDLYSLYKESPATFADPDRFADAFKGIYATTSYGSGCVIPIESTYLNLFYSKHEKTEEGNDTIIKYSGQYCRGGDDRRGFRSQNTDQDRSAHVEAYFVNHWPDDCTGILE